MLPEEATPALIWANDQLRDRKMHSNAVLDEFNKQLADYGIAKISKSAWSRHAVRTAIEFRELDEFTRMSAEVVRQLGSEGDDDSTVHLALKLKNIIHGKCRDPATLKPKDILDLARALSASVGSEKASAENKKRRQELLETVDKAIEKAVASNESPDAQAVLKKIREDVYGIFDR